MVLVIGHYLLHRVSTFTAETSGKPQFVAEPLWLLHFFVLLGTVAWFDRSLPNSSMLSCHTGRRRAMLHMWSNKSILNEKDTNSFIWVTHSDMKHFPQPECNVHWSHIAWKVLQITSLFKSSHVSTGVCYIFFGTKVQGNVDCQVPGIVWWCLFRSQRNS